IRRRHDWRHVERRVFYRPEKRRTEGRTQGVLGRALRRRETDRHRRREDAWFATNLDVAALRQDGDSAGANVPADGDRRRGGYHARPPSSTQGNGNGIERRRLDNRANVWRGTTEVEGQEIED